MKLSLFLAMAGVSFLAPAAYLNGNVTVEQAADSKLVTVTYALDNAAIVTLCVETNRGDGVFAEMTDTASCVGDVNRLVPAGSGKRIVWQPTRDFANRQYAASDLRVRVKTWTQEVPPDYLVVDLVKTNSVKYYPHTGAFPGGFGDRRYKTEYLVMRRIPANGVTYLMGADSNEVGVATVDLPQHRVTFTNDFYIGVYELTQGQFMNIMRMAVGGGTNTSAYDGEDRDVHPLESTLLAVIRGGSSGYNEGYDWPDNGHTVGDGSVLAHLRANSGIASFDLPTEARWEYAYRAGSSSAFHNGKEVKTMPHGQDSNLDEIAWNYYNTGYATTKAVETREVGLLQPNDWGLYDMSGNVGEIMNGRLGAGDGSDWYGATDVTDPPGPSYKVGGVATNWDLVTRGNRYTEWASSQFRAGTRVRKQVQGNPGSSFGYRLMCDVEIR